MALSKASTVPNSPTLLRIATYTLNRTAAIASRRPSARAP